MSNSSEEEIEEELINCLEKLKDKYGKNWIEKLSDEQIEQEVLNMASNKILIDLIMHEIISLKYRRWK